MKTMERKAASMLARDCQDILDYINDAKRVTHCFSIYSSDLKKQIMPRFARMLARLESKEYGKSDVVTKKIGRIRKSFAAIRSYYVNPYSFMVAQNCPIDAHEFLSGKINHELNMITRTLQEIFSEDV